MNPENKNPPLPDESYVRPPETPIDANALVYDRSQMSHFYDAPGEFGWFIEGADYALQGLSVLTTETQPGGGPPLHCHECNEAHVIAAGERYRGIIGDEVFDIVGPAIVRVPANVPHTFINAGESVLHLVGILPTGRVDYTELGPNPLVEDPAATSGADPSPRKEDS